ncbi:hypothetical protein PROSTU_01188 [Providencia stuartii ATCC 25827]|uniref:Uncharacterized protein n=1 Tax=Providencia stuartii ATCC 25827 TaxID=471874 RepID=A0AA86Z1N4_PROST|nr:hypothetical protein PROSTU_01188 [Providencia stuartii ATCC 25827]
MPIAEMVSLRKPSKYQRVTLNWQRDLIVTGEKAPSDIIE